ncbi:DoxX family protein [Xaviernesmea oryzae]|uniref:DoxX family protein n=1 Tax=Xaviernesmea oryzae TaxID=464029 RepID=A0A1Q9B1N5_9HYPH|nr:DoxX family protein [Xaviernesmea oryzae]OLP61894.1 DoxX family protein [Xaviernesmea oryzae]SEL74056.1 transmembrane protein [Xaviernesmea oryzae]
MTQAFHSIIASRAFGVAARIVLTFMFWGSGLSKLLDFEAAKAEMAFFGLQPAALIAVLVIVTQLVGAGLIISGRLVWLGAGMLAVFTALTIPIAHAFWTMAGDQALHEFYVAVEHISIIGALMVVAWKTAPAPSLVPAEANRRFA